MVNATEVGTYRSGMGNSPDPSTVQQSNSMPHQHGDSKGGSTAPGNTNETNANQTASTPTPNGPSNGSGLLREWAAQVPYGVGLGFGFGNINLGNNTDKLVAVANQHFNYLRSTSINVEMFGYLISTIEIKWVRWSKLTQGTGKREIRDRPDVLTDEYDNNFHVEWGEIAIAEVHTHPSDNAFSPVDITTFLANSVLRQNPILTSGIPLISIVVGLNYVFTLEVTNLDMATKIYDEVGPDGIESIWWTAYNNATGNTAQKTETGVKAVIQRFNRSLLFKRY